MKPESRKSPSRPVPVARPAVLLVLLAAGALAARALDLPLSAALTWLGLGLLLALRVGAMIATVRAPEEVPPVGPRADAHGPTLRAANG